MLQNLKKADKGHKGHVFRSSARVKDKSTHGGTKDATEMLE